MKKTSHESALQLIKTLQPGLWILVCILMFYFLFMTLVEMLGVPFLQQNWKYDQETAGEIISIFTMISAFSPLVGKMIDEFYNYCHYLTIVIGVLGAVSLSIIMYIDPLFGFIIYGVFSTFRSSITFPIISKYCEPNQIGIANAILKTIDNFFGCLLALSAGIIYTIFGDYLKILQVGLIFCILGIIFSVWLVNKEVVYDVPK